jgi:hypothetical protein
MKSIAIISRMRNEAENFKTKCNRIPGGEVFHKGRGSCSTPQCLKFDIILIWYLKHWNKEKKSFQLWMNRFVGRFINDWYSICGGQKFVYYPNGHRACDVQYPNLKSNIPWTQSWYRGATQPTTAMPWFTTHNAAIMFLSSALRWESIMVYIMNRLPPTHTYLIADEVKIISK